MDPLRHPDLVEISRSLRLQLTQVLEAEQEAAAITLRRRSTLRDRLLDTEDQNEAIRVTCVGGTIRTGRIRAVGIDHIVVEADGHSTCIGIAHIVALEVAS